MSSQPTPNPAAPLYRFGDFELDAATGELRHRGMRVRIHVQPLQVLQLLLERPGELVTREDLCAVLWPTGTFVDFEHGVNSAINRLREALGDRASAPKFVETLARRGYRFVAPVEKILRDAEASKPVVEITAKPEWTLLAQPEDLPSSSPQLVRGLFLALQAMYLAFYVGTLANLAEVHDLLSPWPEGVFTTVWVSAALLIAVRLFLISAVLFSAPGFRLRFLRMWPLLLVVDLGWALGPILLLHHLSVGAAIACIVPLIYAPFAQRSLVLMGAAENLQA
ncbi:transcriptional regulator [Granulicella cerasi]|uniref:Transcriptional regulator n=2 Tax=Granulicella cerasi TaxID=741063 RepID=A0ABW1Z757_9BACT